MKKLLIILSVTMLSVSLFAQTSQADKRLSAAFTSEEVKAMDIETLRFNTYCIENAYIVMDMPIGKENDQEINGARNIKNIDEINFFDLNVTLKEDSYQYFKLLGTDKLLAIKPISLLKSEIK